ncbi:MAG: ATP-binding protein [Spirochaetaceae bacterium]|jgi:anti-sigma regulatory factor (Ser/Thr protein kinase)|nr:ATP-binding protein [Spirochaetaceae bacterium]
MNNYTNSLHIGASESNLDTVLDWVEHILENNAVDNKTIGRIKVVSEEVFINIAQYAYKEQNISANEAVADITLDIHDNKLTLSFNDRGVPFNPLEKSDPDISADIEDRPIGGLGIFITKKWMDTVQYERKDGKNVLTLEKIL